MYFLGGTDCNGSDIFFFYILVRSTDSDTKNRLYSDIASIKGQTHCQPLCSESVSKNTTSTQPNQACFRVLKYSRC